MSCLTERARANQSPSYHYTFFQKSFITPMRQRLTEEPAINTAARNAQLDIFLKSNERHN